MKVYVACCLALDSGTGCGEFYPEIDCVESGGTYQGDGTLCEDVFCEEMGFKQVAGMVCLQRMADQAAGDAASAAGVKEASGSNPAMFD